jgi:predicted DNA-binding transcriptional regulator AlpA
MSAPADLVVSPKSADAAVDLLRRTLSGDERARRQLREAIVGDERTRSPFITTEELASILNCAVGSIRRAELEGRVPPRDGLILGRVVWRRERIEEWLNGQLSPAGAKGGGR